MKKTKINQAVQDNDEKAIFEENETFCTIIETKDSSNDQDVVNNEYLLLDLMLQTSLSNERNNFGFVERVRKVHRDLRSKLVRVPIWFNMVKKDIYEKDIIPMYKSENSTNRVQRIQRLKSIVKFTTNQKKELASLLYM